MRQRRDIRISERMDGGGDGRVERGGK